MVLRVAGELARRFSDRKNTASKLAGYTREIASSQKHLIGIRARGFRICTSPDDNEMAMSQNPQTPQRVIPIEQSAPYAPQYAPYGMPVPPRVPSRPGILTATGVVSIVLACLMVISNCGSIISVMVITAASRAMNVAMTSAAAAATQAAAAHADPSQEVKPRGIVGRHQLIVVAGLSRTHQISPARTKMLKILLADAGQDMFVMDPTQLTPANVSANVSQSGQLPGVGGKLGNDYFIIGNGRIELADDHAVFAPSGGGEVVRVYEKAQTTEQDEDPNATANATVPAPAATTLPFTPPPPPFSDRSAMMGILDAVIGCILAIFLFICGLLVLRDSPAARRMHLAWAILKLPLAVVGGVATWMMLHDMGAAGSGGGSGAQSAGQEVFASMMTVLTVLLVCAYPVAVLIVMNRKTAREYYASRPAG